MGERFYSCRQEIQKTRFGGNLRMKEVILYGAAIMFRHLFQRTHLFLVLFTAMEIVDVEQMQMRLLLSFFHHISPSLHLIFRVQVCLMVIMSVLVGTRKMTSRLSFHTLETILIFHALVFGGGQWVQ
nr:uncharacterized protein LOC103702352 isoform X4 [Ipomoea batatas]